jgi:hypothetical protein
MEERLFGQEQMFLLQILDLPILLLGIEFVYEFCLLQIDLRECLFLS